MRKDTIHKHYCISREIVDKIKARSKGRFNTEVQAVEFYLKQGFDFEDSTNEKEKMLYMLNQCLSEVRFLKKISYQLLVNMGARANEDIKSNELYKDFINRVRKSNFDG